MIVEDRYIPNLKNAGTTSLAKLGDMKIAEDVIDAEVE